MRAFSRSLLLGCAAALAASLGAGAQSLQRVNVTSFVLSADTAHPHAGQTFHITVTLRLRGDVRNVENLQLPLLAGLQVLGDVRGVVFARENTTYKETITVAARSRGALTIPPATFDAIDARSGKAEEYSSNALPLNVGGASLASKGALTAARILVSAGVALVVLGIVLAFSMRRRHVPQPAQEPQPQPPSPGDPLAEALERLERNQSRRGALEARTILWRMVGAGSGETLADVIEASRQRHPELMRVLLALERAAFTHDDDVHGGVQQALAALKAAQ
ncbi:MAG: BatD family protein [Candidatus Tyrphobacter sp.]